MKIKLSIIASSLLLITTCIFAESTNVAHDKSKANNEVDNREKYSENIQQGWGMYYENNQTNPEEQSQQNNDMEQQGSDSNKTVIQLLSELLKTNKEILKTDKEILEVLKNEYDPQPKTIKGADGTECKENESANCYSMPTFTKEAKLPVYKNFFANPSIQSAAEVVMWEDKHIFEVRKRGALQQQALMHFGDDVRPHNGLSRVGYQDIKGRYSKEFEKGKRKLIFNVLNQNNLEVQFFFGNNYSQNTSLISQVNKFLRVFELYGSIPASIFFKSAEAKQQIDAVLELLTDRNLNNKSLKALNKFIVEQQQYDERMIKSIPSVAILNRSNNEFQIISSGSNDVDSIVALLFRYLEIKGFIQANQISDSRIVDESSNIYDVYVEEEFSPTKEEKELLKIGVKK